MQKIIISLGGSVIAPDSLDLNFLRRFRNLIEKYPKKRFIIVCGGGKLARELQKRARELGEVKDSELDWLGIYATRMNALALKNVFGIKGSIITNPNEKVRFENAGQNKGKVRVAIASGWKPGFSTDYDAVLLFKNINADILVNITNVDYIYDREPKLKGARAIRRTSWEELRKIVKGKWKPGLNMPFDPIASKEAEKIRVRAVVIGKDLANLKKVLENKAFKGTLIERLIEK